MKIISNVYPSMVVWLICLQYIAELYKVASCPRPLFLYSWKMQPKISVTKCYCREIVDCFLGVGLKTQTVWMSPITRQSQTGSLFVERLWGPQHNSLYNLRVFTERHKIYGNSIYTVCLDLTRFKHPL